MYTHTYICIEGDIFDMLNIVKQDNKNFIAPHHKSEHIEKQIALYTAMY